MSGRAIKILSELEIGNAAMQKEKDIEKVKKILIKVTKNKVAKEIQQSVQSEGSLNSNAITSKKIYLKSLSDLHKTSVIKREYLYRAALGMAYTLVALVAMLGLADYIREFCDVNARLYSLNDNLVHIDIVVRKSIVPMEVGFSTSANIGLYDLYLYVYMYMCEIIFN